jgi:hypothetical protein
MATQKVQIRTALANTKFSQNITESVDIFDELRRGQ